MVKPQSAEGRELVSPPCQGISRAGKQLVDDPRNDLWREAARLLRDIRPKVFVLENVPALRDAKFTPLLQEMLEAICAAGYAMKHWIVDCSQYSVPQARRRFVGTAGMNLSESNRRCPNRMHFDSLCEMLWETCPPFRFEPRPAVACRPSSPE